MKHVCWGIGLGLQVVSIWREGYDLTIIGVLFCITGLIIHYGERHDH